MTTKDIYDFTQTITNDTPVDTITGFVNLMAKYNATTEDYLCLLYFAINNKKGGFNGLKNELINSLIPSKEIKKDICNFIYSKTNFTIKFNYNDTPICTLINKWCNELNLPVPTHRQIKATI